MRKVKVEDTTLPPSDEKYRLLVENANEAIVVAQDGLLKFFNPKTLEITGYSEKELAKKPFIELVHPDDRKSVIKNYERRLRGEKFHQVYSFRIIDKKGNVRWLQINAVLINWEGRPATLNFLSDITERKKAEALQSALYRIAEITNSTLDLGEFYASVHAIVGELIDARNFYIALFDESSKVLTFPYFVDEFDSQPKPRKLRKGLTEYVLRTGQSLLSTEETFRKLKERGEVELVGSPAVNWLGVPLKNGEKTIGVLVVQSYTKNLRYGEREKELLTYVSQHIATAIERKRAEEELKKSEMRFRSIAQSAIDGIILADQRGKIIFWNDGAQLLFGYREEEVLGKPLTLLMPRSYREPHLRGLRSSSRGSKSHILGRTVELRGLRKDGKEFPLELSLASWRAGKETFYSAIIRDITERKETEKALRESEERFRSIVENSHAGILIVDEQFRFTYVNDQLCKILERPREEIIGRDFREFLDQQSKDMVAERYLRRQRGEKVPSRYEFNIVRKNGEARRVEISSTVIRDSTGKVITIAQILDITERKMAEERLKQSYQKLQKAMEGTIRAIARIVEMRDPYTSGHQQRVARLATAIAREMGLQEDQIHSIQMAALIHDIGKIYIPAEILSKPSLLSETEIHLIEAHPQVGYDILKSIEFPWPVATIVLQHHERMDGSGYPQGLKGDQIIMEARILGVADVVEAMASHRPYRPALGISKALKEILKKRGTLYDPNVVDTCLKLCTKKRFRF